MTEEFNVTYWKNLRTSTGGQSVKLDRILNAIKTGADWLKTIEQIRAVAILENTKENRAEKDKLKQKLPGVSFSGIFEERKLDKLIESNGLMCLDFDHTTEIPEDLFLYTYATWISASGDGRKMLIRIPLVKDDVQYKSYFATLEKKYPGLDKSGKDICRLTYMSYDPEIIINPAAKIYTDKSEVKAQPLPTEPAPSTLTLNRLTPKGSEHQVQSNYAKITIALKMIQQAPVGNRHETILKAGKLLGGYIGSGEVIEEDVKKIFEPEVLSIMDHPRDFRVQWQTFLKGIEYGKALPIKDRERERKSIKAEFAAEDVYGDIYYTAADKSAELDELYEKGWSKGKTTGWKNFDELYSVLPGYFTIGYGAPFNGKTYWFFNLLINMAELHGDLSVVWSPETGSATDVYAALIEIHAGGDLTKTFKNQISKEQYQISKDFIDRHFLILDTEETDYQFTMESLMLYVSILERKLNVKFQNVMVDPLIELLREEEVRDDLYWNATLRVARVQAKRNKWHLFLLTHIVRQQRIGIDEDGKAIFPIPTPYDIYSGQTFYRKGFQILCFYRHSFNRERMGDVMTLKPLGNLEVQHNSLFIFVQKSKPKGVGKIGDLEFLFDPKTNRSSDKSTPTRNFKPIHKEQTPFQATLPYSESKDDPEWVTNQ